MDSFKNQFVARFRGVRGSYPVSGKPTLHYGGNTPCIEIRVGGHLLILDAGTGIINLGKEIVQQGLLNKTFPIYLLLTHIHHDHIQGLPYFAPLFLGTTRLYIYGPRTSPISFSEALHRNFFHPFFPIELEDTKSTDYLDTLEEAEALIIDRSLKKPLKRHVFRQGFVKAKNPVIVTTLKVYAHPNGGVNVYKIRWQEKVVVFATDIEGYVGGDSRLIKFASGADLLIHDTHYLIDEYAHPVHPRQGFGHSTIEHACEVAQKAKVKQLALFHHSPEHSDKVVKKKEKTAKKIFPHSFAAREGDEIFLLKRQTITRKRSKT